MATKPARSPASPAARAEGPAVRETLIVEELPPDKESASGWFVFSDGARVQCAEHRFHQRRRIGAMARACERLDTDDIETMMLACAYRLTKQGKNKSAASLRIGSMLYLAVFCRRNGIGFRDVDALTAVVSNKTTWRAKANARTQLEQQFGLNGTAGGNGKAKKKDEDDEEIGKLPAS